MTYTIVGCGSSAQNWIPRGYTIGVNDAFQFGQAFNALLICNRPQTFRQDRFETIIKTPHEKFYSHKADWVKWFPDWHKINLVTWYGTWRGNQVYCSDTSPFIAVSLAATLGAKDIILWGVDFVNHHIHNAQNTQTEREVKKYLEMFSLMNEAGINIWLGTNGSVFDKHLKTWDS